MMDQLSLRLLFVSFFFILFLNHQKHGHTFVQGDDDRGKNGEENIVEIDITGNPHKILNKTTTKSTDSTDSTNQQCPDPCVSNLHLFKYVLQYNNLITKVQKTQQDTLKSISYVSVESIVSSLGSLPNENEESEQQTDTRTNMKVPIYHFQQPKRISSHELPFQLMLVRDLASVVPHYITQVPMKHAQDSWFLNCYWSIVIICDCQTGMFKHIGWKFTSLLNDDDDSHQEDGVKKLSHFYAIIVQTNTTPTKHTKLNDKNTHEKQQQYNVQVMGLNAPDWMVTNMLHQNKNMSKSNTHSASTTSSGVAGGATLQEI